MRQVVQFIFILLLLAAGTTRAGEGRVPVWEPGVIDEPGHYFLTRDIAATVSDGIVIETDGVVLDLGGRTVSVPDGSNYFGIRVDLSGMSDARYGVVIRNGRVGGGQIGIYAPTIPAFLRIESVEVTGTGSHGILGLFAGPPTVVVGVPAFFVADSFIHDVGGDGVKLADPRPSPLCEVMMSANLISGSGGDGIDLDGCTDGFIKENRIEDFGQLGGPAAGIRLTGGAVAAQPVVDSNTIGGGGSQATGVIADISQPVVDFLFSNNIISENGEDGIRIQGGIGHIRDNLVSGNTGNGLHCMGGVNLFIEGNYLAENSGYGLVFDQTNGHAYRDNFLRGNRIGAVGGEPNTDAGGNIP